MWFDVQAALKEIEGGLTATSATSATNAANTTKNRPNVANVASVATLSPAQNTSSNSPDTDAFEERTAIVEFDGGLSRVEAERLAAQCQGYDNVVAFRAAQQTKTKRKCQ